MFDYLRADVTISGTAPRLPRGAKIMVEDYSQQFSRAGPGLVRPCQCYRVGELWPSDWGIYNTAGQDWNIIHFTDTSSIQSVSESVITFITRTVQLETIERGVPLLDNCLWIWSWEPLLYTVGSEVVINQISRWGQLYNSLLSNTTLTASMYYHTVITEIQPHLLHCTTRFLAKFQELVLMFN